VTENLKRKLGQVTLEKVEEAELASRVATEVAQKIGAFTDYQKMVIAVAVLEKSRSASLPQVDLRKLFPYHLSEELPDIVQKYATWFKIRSFCTWGSISSIVFLVSGIYLLISGHIAMEIGGPLVILFALLSSVFTRKLLQWRKP